MQMMNVHNTDENRSQKYVPNLFRYKISTTTLTANKYGLTNISIVFFASHLYKNCFKNNYELFLEFFIHCKINELFWHVCTLFFYKF